MGTDATVVLFVRAPVRNEVKTRLAASIGAEAAFAAYLRLVDHALLQLNGLAFPLHCWHTGAASLLREQWPGLLGLEMRQQVGASLGERMASVFAAYDGPVVLIGSDCPAIDANYVHLAVAALNRGFDLVLGPASDGGYGLIGMHRLHSSLFENMQWGTNQVCAATQKQAKLLNLSQHLLSPIWDVDEVDDWSRFRREYTSG